MAERGMKVIKNFETQMVEFYYNGKFIKQREMTKRELKNQKIDFEDSQPEEKTIVKRTETGFESIPNP